MFSKTEKPMSQHPGAIIDAPVRQPPKNDGVPSIISEDLTIVGSLSSNGEVQIDGHVEGDITGHIVTVSTGAKIDGSIKAQTVHVSGEVGGQIEGDSVMIAKPARVRGDVLHNTLAIEAGAYVEGFCRPKDTNAVAIEPSAPVKLPELKPAPTPQAAPSEVPVARVAGAEG